jgi:hypothetical protein
VCLNARGFQLDAELDTLGEEQTFQVLDKKTNRWAEIKSKIRVDLDIRSNKTKQLWELLDQFIDVFTWHKRELSYCIIGEHVVDTQGFPPCCITPNRLSFWEEAEVKR